MRLLYYFGLAIVVVIIDQWSKWLIVKYMQVGQSIEIVPNLLYLTSNRNKGAKMGNAPRTAMAVLYLNRHCCHWHHLLHGKIRKR